MSENLSGINWRYTGMKARLGPFDAFLVFPPMLFYAIHIKWWTFFLMLFVIVAMWMIEIFLGMPLNVALRTLRSKLAGDIRPSVPWWKKNKF